jgi:hypothetical protein
VAGALPLFQRALDTRERVLGTEHPRTLTSVNNLAACMRALGDAEAALPLFRRALGKEHPDTRTARANCDLVEQEVAAARRRSDAGRTDSQPITVPSWRRLIG